MNTTHTQNHDLLKRVHEIKVEIGKLRMDRAMGKMTNTNTIMNKKKEIARLLSAASRGVIYTTAGVAAPIEKTKKEKKVKKEEKA